MSDIIKGRVSVIVPVYNTDAKYLWECAQSILQQDYRDIELLLINDGSTDKDTIDICEKISESDNRVCYLVQENNGVSVARNNGLNHAAGEFVLFVDGDDFISEGIVGKLMSAVKEDMDILFYGYCTSYTNREMRRVIDKADPKLFTAATLQLAILNGNPRLGPLEVGAPWGKLIRRSVIEDNNIRYTKGLKKGQDTVFTLGLLEHCRNMAYLAEAGYHYRISSASISHRFNENIVEIMERTLVAYKEFIERNNKGSEFGTALLNKHYQVMTREYLDLYFINKKNPKDEKTLRREYLKLMDTEPYKSALKGMDTGKLSGLDAIELFMVKHRMIGLFFMEKRLLAFARQLIVKDYE